MTSFVLPQGQNWQFSGRTNHGTSRTRPRQRMAWPPAPSSGRRSLQSLQSSLDSPAARPCRDGRRGLAVSRPGAAGDRSGHCRRCGNPYHLHREHRRRRAQEYERRRNLRGRQQWARRAVDHCDGDGSPESCRRLREHPVRRVQDNRRRSLVAQDQRPGGRRHICDRPVESGRHLHRLVAERRREQDHRWRAHLGRGVERRRHTGRVRAGRQARRAQCGLRRHRRVRGLPIDRWRRHVAAGEYRLDGLVIPRRSTEQGCRLRRLERDGRLCKHGRRKFVRASWHAGCRRRPCRSRAAGPPFCGHSNRRRLGEQ